MHCGCLLASIAGDNHFVCSGASQRIENPNEYAEITIIHRRHRHWLVKSTRFPSCFSGMRRASVPVNDERWRARGDATSEDGRPLLRRCCPISTVLYTCCASHTLAGRSAANDAAMNRNDDRCVIRRPPFSMQRATRSVSLPSPLFRPTAGDPSSVFANPNSPQLPNRYNGGGPDERHRMRTEQTLSPSGRSAKIANERINRYRPNNECH
jgi:hypothetical protein